MPDNKVEYIDTDMKELPRKWIWNYRGNKEEYWFESIFVGNMLICENKRK